ncbi:hypothetical protein BG011_001083 [Mortierella polycephala]|uniref:Uncharacterized protein n=1 Tax=Mortierella polycephala TaxID=41804 RepID=A0A9P6PL85_9FUNG|nr:hypothetical protein BG011_001083 [Mortierella polycephala]
MTWASFISTRSGSEHTNAKMRNNYHKSHKLDQPESERLPRTMADMQYGQCVKTAQRHKNYAIQHSVPRVQQLSNHQFHRSDTTAQYAAQGDYGDDDDPKNPLGLTTGVLNLKEIEESIMVPM